MPDVPLGPGGGSTLVVDKSGEGDYASIQQAVDAAGPGDVIKVKDGTYQENVVFTKNGTKSQAIALVSFDGHSPVIQPPQEGNGRVEVQADWIYVESFEIRNGYEGIKLHEDHFTVRNCRIHDNYGQGILVVNANHILIENNILERNGLIAESPKHNHGIYLSDFHKTGMHDILIRSNILKGNGGRGIQWNGYSGPSTEFSENGLHRAWIENNVFEDNSWGLVLYHNAQGAVIRNNTFVTQELPKEHNDGSHHPMFSIWGPSCVDNVFVNNLFYSDRSDVQAVELSNADVSRQVCDYNLWTGTVSSGPSQAGWGQHSINTSEPGFEDLSGGDYSLSSGSPAVDKAIAANAPLTDFSGNIRDENPDIGAFELGGSTRVLCCGSPRMAAGLAPGILPKQGYTTSVVDARGRLVGRMRFASDDWRSIVSITATGAYIAHAKSSAGATGTVMMLPKGL